MKKQIAVKRMMVLTFVIIIAFGLSASYKVYSASKKKTVNVEFVTPKAGEKIRDELTLQINVALDKESAKDASSEWKVEYYACGNKVAEGSSIEAVYKVVTNGYKRGRCLIVVNVMDRDHNLGIAHRYVNIIDSSN